MKRTKKLSPHRFVDFPGQGMDEIITNYRSKRKLVADLMKAIANNDCIPHEVYIDGKKYTRFFGTIFSDANKQENVVQITHME